MSQLPPITIIAPPLSNKSSDPTWITGLARHVEACGFAGIALVEHSVMISSYSSTYPYDRSGRVELAPDCDLPDPLDVLSYLAGQTTALTLATSVLVLPNHHPVALAKRLATIDQLSGGRVRVAVGMGWMREELEACGVDFATRGKRADEQIQVMRALWADTGDVGASYHGEFFAFDGAVSYPKPVQRPGVPIIIGGHSKAAARRAGRYGDGLQPLGVGGDDLTALVDLMRRSADEAGRDPANLQLILGHLVAKLTAERAESLVAKGATGISLAMSPTDDLDAARAELTACADRLGLAAR